LYALACSIFLYILAGGCLSALVAEFKSETPNARPLSIFGVAAVISLLLLVPIAYVCGIQPGKINLGFVVVHSIVFAFPLILFWLMRRKGTFALEWPIYGACVVALLMQFGYNFATRRPIDKAIAQIIQPYVQETSPETLSLIASNFKSYQFYSFRRGCYWHELPLQENPSIVLERERYRNARAFILDPEEQKSAELEPWLAWLKTHAIEKTGELDTQLGKVSGFLLFVKNPSS